MTSIAEHLIDLAQLAPEQFAEQRATMPMRPRRTRRPVIADDRDRAFVRQQVRRAARKLEDPEIVIALSWALLQITGCLRPGEAALSPITRDFHFGAATFRRFRVP